MDDTISIILRTNDGNSTKISAPRSLSLREAVSESKNFSQIPGDFFFLYNGIDLHIDLSLYALDLKDNDVIYIVKRRHIKPPNLNFYSDIRKRYYYNESGPALAYQEALKMSDLQFSNIELDRGAQHIYGNMRRKQNKLLPESPSIPSCTNFMPTAPASISQTTLPMPWTTNGKPYIRCPVVQYTKNSTDNQQE